MTAIHKTPELAIQFEASLLAQFSNPDITNRLAFWTTDQCLVAPVSLTKRENFAESCSHMAAMGWPVVVRKTGGGVTPQGPGILNIALAYALDPVESPSINGVYQMFCSPLIQLLEQYGCSASTGFVEHCFCDGEFNIVTSDRKVMGTAQRWSRVKSAQSRQIVFAHALILYDADLQTSIAAVNQLHEACGMDNTVEVDAHANLQSLASANNHPINQSAVIETLSRLYREELIALTE